MFLLGILLAATAGLRGYLPLFALGVTACFFHFPLNDSVGWIASPFAIGAFAIAAFVEFVADKIPGADHLMDAIHTFVRPIAGALVMTGVLPNNAAVWGILAIILAGGTALGVHALKSALRVAVTPMTLGMGNWVVSLVEDIVVVVAMFSNLHSAS